MPKKRQEKKNPKKCSNCSKITTKNEADKKASLEKPKTFFMTYGKMLFFFQKQIAMAMTLAFDF